jgi:hypothetical protein
MWAVTRLALDLVTLIIFSATGGAAAMRAMALVLADKTPPADLLQGQFAQAAPSFLLATLLNLAGGSILYTAMLRAILRPADSAFAYLRLSAQELRQFILALIGVGLFFSYLVLASLAVPLTVSLAQGLGQVGVLLTLVTLMVLAVALIYPAVRLSLAPAMTFLEGRLTLFRAAPLTRRAFWPILSAYCLALILALIVVLLGEVMFFLVFAAVGSALGGGMSGATALLASMHPDDTSIAGLFLPLRLVDTAFTAGLATLAYVLVAAPSALILRETLGGASSVAAVPGRSTQPWG